MHYHSFLPGGEGERADAAAGRGDVRVQLARGGGRGLQGGRGPPPRPAAHVHQRARHRAGLRVAGTDPIQITLQVIADTILLTHLNPEIIPFKKQGHSLGQIYYSSNSDND